MFTVIRTKMEIKRGTMSEKKNCFTCKNHDDGEGFVMCELGKGLDYVALICPYYEPREDAENTGILKLGTK